VLQREKTYGENVVVDDTHAEHCLEEGVRELRLSRQERACFVRTGGDKSLLCALLPLSARSVIQRGRLCAHLHLAHDVKELSGRHGPDRFRDLVDGRLARLDRNALR
jgi:DUF917 family protein